MNPKDQYMQQKRSEQKYRRSIQYLDGKFAYFLTHILKIGEPDWTMGIPTAAVALPKKTEDINDFKFLFNPAFADHLDDEVFTFVLAHETMHMLLNHLFQAKKYKNHKKFNIAADCVINDYLTAAGLKGSPEFCYGQDFVGYNCANATVSEVYDAIPDDKIDQSGGDQGDGRGAGALDDHGWMHDGTTEQSDGLDKLYKDAQDQMPADMDKRRADDEHDAKDAVGDLAGTGVGEIEEFQKQFGAKLNWVQLMKMINPDVFKRKAQGPPERPSFHQPRRKLVAHYPEIMLPVKRVEKRRIDHAPEQPAIVMALDTSGSISEKDRHRFITLAQSVPKERIKIFACTFTYGYEPLDLDNPHFRSGGTNFSAIEDFIHDHVIPELGHYPKSVVVITDGEAGFPGRKVDDKHKDKWLWLLTDHYQTYGIEGIGKHVKLGDFVA